MNNTLKMLSAGLTLQFASGCTYIVEKGDKDQTCTDLLEIEQRYLGDKTAGERLSATPETAVDIGCHLGKQWFLTPFRAGAFMIECPLWKALDSVSSTENSEEKQNTLPPACDFLE